MNQNTKVNRDTILKERSQLLNNNSDVFKTQNIENRRYIRMLDQLEPQLTSFQKQALTGLILSDASVELKDTFTKSGRRKSRIKIQQTLKNLGLLNHLKFDLFVEFSSNNGPIKMVSSNRTNMYEYDTLTCGNFSEVNQLFSKKDLSAKQTKTLKKEINQNIKDELTPVAIAYWFCGDGGKVNYQGSGKGINLATDCFNKDDVNFLADCLKEVGLDTNVILTNKTKEQYEINLTGPSFDLFIEKVGPYIPKSMAYKLPIGRVKTSNWGYMTEEFKQTIIGSHFEKHDWIYSDINWDNY